MSFQPPYPRTSWICPTWLDPHVCSPTPSSFPPSQSHTCVFKDPMQVRGTPHWEGMWLVSFPAFRGKMSGEDMLERVGLEWGRQQDLHIDLCYSWSLGSKPKASLQGYVLVTKSCARSWEMAIQILSETHPSSSHWNSLPLQTKIIIRKTGKQCVLEGKQEALPRKCPSPEFSRDRDWRQESNRNISPSV